MPTFQYANPGVIHWGSGCVREKLGEELQRLGARHIQRHASHQRACGGDQREAVRAGWPRNRQRQEEQVGESGKDAPLQQAPAEDHPPGPAGIGPLLQFGEDTGEHAGAVHS